MILAAHAFAEVEVGSRGGWVEFFSPLLILFSLRWGGEADEVGFTVQAEKSKSFLLFVCDESG